MRKLIIAVIGASVFVTVLAGCAKKAQLTESERTTPPPPGPRAGYTPPPAGAIPGRGAGQTPAAPPPQQGQGR